MYKINLYSVGKNKETWLNDALKEYQKRLQKQIQLLFNFSKTTEQMVKALQNESFIICLDPKGEELSSESFAQFLKQNLEKNGCNLALVIGESRGLPLILKKHPLVSFSKMIFTHQLSRLIITEQIYRAVQIWNRSPYHFS